jgi:exopolysaccharide/PEP-CTERM locus tyrosine autokinase
VPGAVDVILNHEKLSKEGVTPFGDMADKIVDEFRRLKRPLLRAAFDEHEESAQRKNLILICSALSGEGKTFTAMNLAMCIALERDRTVVLVDGDISKPHISRMLEVQDKPGLMDLLQDHSLDIGEVLLQTDMPSLKIIPAGQRHRQASELLSSHRMAAITEELATRYSDRIVLFDSSPTLQTSEAPALAALMGQIIMVVHTGQTPQRAVTTALGMYAGRDVQVVLNKCRAMTSSPYYGNYYAAR